MRRRIHFIFKDKIFYKKYRVVIVVVLVFSLTFNIIGISSYILTQTLVKQNRDFEQLQKKYPLVSKRVLQDTPIDIIVNFLPLRKDLKTEVAPWGKSFGMYFEYLPTGTSININGLDEFYAASLFKTPIVMAYYRTRDRLGKTDDPILEIKNEDIDGKFGNLWKKGVGYKLKSSEAIRLAMEESDNTAARLLVPYISPLDFEAVYQGLDIDLNLNKNGAILTAKSYSSIFKALYFSSVLSINSSQEILNMLTHTIFPDKIVAGVPSDITVAHKIGDFIDKDGNQAFTDCGIVYVPRRPYMLCMISRTDEQTARERMQDVSKMIYDFVSSINAPQTVN